MKDFPELRTLPREEALLVIGEARDAMRLDSEQRRARRTLAGRGPLWILGLAIALPALVIALAVVAIRLGLEIQFFLYLKYGLLVLVLPVILCMRSLGKRRLSPYILAALARHAGNATHP